MKRFISIVCAVSIAFSMTACAAKNDAAIQSEAATATSSAKAEKLTLSNPDATKKATELFDYICSIYGKKILSGQQESTWMGSDQYEFDYIE